MSDQISVVISIPISASSLLHHITIVLSLVYKVELPITTQICYPGTLEKLFVSSYIFLEIEKFERSQMQKE